MARKPRAPDLLSQIELERLVSEAMPAVRSWIASMRALNEWRLAAERAGVLNEVVAELARENPDIYLTYIIKDIASGDIKIGKTRHLEDRVETFSVAASRGIEIIACFLGGRNGEHDLHDWFDEDRLCGEWFSPSPDVLAFLSAISSEKRTVMAPFGPRHTDKSRRERSRYVRKMQRRHQGQVK